MRKTYSDDNDILNLLRHVGPRSLSNGQTDKKRQSYSQCMEDSLLTCPDMQVMADGALSLHMLFFLPPSPPVPRVSSVALSIAPIRNR